MRRSSDLTKSVRNSADQAAALPAGTSKAAAKLARGMIMKRIALFDLSGIFRAAWHASEHQEIGEAYRRTISTVHGAASDFDACGICIDRPPYMRKEIDPNYKAHREAAPQALYEQQSAAIEALRHDGLPVFGLDGYEADDIIATLCVWAVGAGHEVTIFSSDKDILSLVGERVSVISAATKQVYGPAEVKARFGVAPHLMPDLLALAGDASDNIPGVQGCGPKTAAKWLNEFGGLDGVLNNTDKLGDRFRPLVEAAREQLGISWRLAQLHTDLPVQPEDIMQKKEPMTTQTQTQAQPEETPAAVVIEQPAEASGPLVRVEPAAPVEWNRALEPRDPTQAWRLAGMLYESRMFGDFPNPQAIMAIIMTGRSHGLDAVTSLRGFHCIKGKASPSAQMLIGLVKRHHVCEWFRLVDSNAEAAVWETKRRDEPEPTRLTYTINDAHGAGLLGGDQWKKRPQTMLRWRCGVELARVVYPDIVTGLYTPDELEESNIPPPRTVATPANGQLRAQQPPAYRASR